MSLRRVAFGVFVVAVLCLSAPASAQNVPSSSSVPTGTAPHSARTRPAPAAFLWIPLILVAGSVYAVRIFIRPISRRDRERA